MLIVLSEVLSSYCLSDDELSNLLGNTSDIAYTAISSRVDQNYLSKALFESDFGNLESLLD